MRPWDKSCVGHNQCNRTSKNMRRNSLSQTVYYVWRLDENADDSSFFQASEALVSFLEMPRECLTTNRSNEMVSRRRRSRSLVALIGAVFTVGLLALSISSNQRSGSNTPSSPGTTSRRLPGLDNLPDFSDRQAFIAWLIELIRNFLSNTPSPFPPLAPTPTAPSAAPPSGPSGGTAPTPCIGIDPIVTDVLIVGAGASGLAAAARIKEETNGGLDVTVVECRDQVGGRVQTEMFEGLPVQRGATWLNPGHPTFELYKQSGLKSALDDFLNASLFQISCMVPPTTPAQSSAETVPTELSPTNTPSTAPSVMPAMAPTVARRRLRMEQKKRIDSLVDEFEKDESLSETKKELTRRFLRKLSASGFSQDACAAPMQWTATKTSNVLFETAIDRWRNDILPCVSDRADEFWEEDVDPSQDSGLISVYGECGWNPSDPLQYLVKYLWHDWEYATDDGSIFSWFDPYAPGEAFYMAIDDWAKAFRDFAANNKISPIFNHRVDKIKYDIKRQGSDIRTRVYATNKSSGQCVVFDAQRVISTVSAGVYNNDLIEFDPPLRYPAAQFNPLKEKNYVKIIFKFPTNFWGTKDHYIFTLKSQNPDGIALHWQNYAREGLYPGSNMLLLTLVGKDFEKAVGKENVRKADIDQSVIDELVKPLRFAYPDTFVPPSATYHNKFHSDPDFGYGAYAQWDTGYDPVDYFHFWGPYDFYDYIDECDHNGCNGPPDDKDSEWTLILSGTNVCLESWEFVHSAYYGGVFSANLAMQSLGINVDFDEYPICYR